MSLNEPNIPPINGNNGGVTLNALMDRPVLQVIGSDTLLVCIHKYIMYMYFVAASLLRWLISNP